MDEISIILKNKIDKLLEQYTYFILKNKIGKLSERYYDVLLIGLKIKNIFRILFITLFFSSLLPTFLFFSLKKLIQY